MQNLFDKSSWQTLELKKSVFWCRAFQIASTEDAEELLSQIRQEHKKATHVCYAYILSSPSVERCSDDGEPNGTAGRPILGVMKKNAANNVLVVIVRYYGGIKLGAGGLVRAYVKGAALALQNKNE